jgi:phosphoenolpyruvate synthase/pyruvate phosphate dikinase
MTVATDVVWLDDPNSREPALVGGKAANLARLAARHPVPPGFTLTAGAFDRAWSTGSAPTGLPDHARAQVVAGYAELTRRAGGEPPSVAVRSSAADEDGATASFAGQHETYLNVVGSDAVAEAVLRCWASASSERALAYRRQQGLAADRVRLAVLVQTLIQADVAAVVFSANPLTGSRDEVVVNASWGLGESIVGGTVTPDTYVIGKADGALRSSAIADKARMTVAVPGGTREVDVPRLLRARPSLDDAQAAEAARLAATLEETMGWPVDLECAWSGGRLYLLQCRPITTLGRIAIR